MIKRRAAFHAEDEYRLNDRKHLRIEGDPRSHPVWRDETAALMATQRLVKLAHETGKRIHVLHISTKEEIEFLRDHKDVASCEATPHHLTLAAPECYERLGTRAQMNPPVRDADHRDGIWRGIEQGIVDVLGSDHAPHTLEEKAKTYPASPSGMTGVQTLVPIMLDHVNAGRLSLARFVDLTSAGPGAALQHRLQGPHRRRLRRRFHRRRSQAQRDHHRQMGRLESRLDALRRREGDGLAGRHLRARPPRDVAGRTDDARDRRDGAVSGDVEGVVSLGAGETLHQSPPSSPAKAGDPVFQSACDEHERSGILGRPIKSGDDGVHVVATSFYNARTTYCFFSDVENSPLRTRAGKTFDEFCHGVFAVGADQFGERGEQARLRQAVAVDAIVPRFRPGLVEITERSLLLFMIGQRVAGGSKGHWNAHETQQAWRGGPGRSASC